VIPCKLLARSLVNRGIACLILYSVFHTSRMPEDMRRRAPVFTSDEWFEGYRISVIEVRQAADWACSMPEINHEQISVVGISLGGFISAVAMGVEERLRAGVFITIGGEMLKQSLGRVRLTPSGKATIALRRNADRSTHNTRNILLRSLRRDSPMLLH
jgi:dienelactone hydrolase